MKSCWLWATLIFFMPVSPSPAQDFLPAIVYDIGGKFDQSFNQMAYRGAERFRKETRIIYREFQLTSPQQRIAALRSLAQKGATVVVALGFAQTDAVRTIARSFPNTSFALIDGTVNLPNVRSVLFKEHEGSFLVGMAAAMASKTGAIGFIGGMDSQLVRNFADGYQQGAHYIDPDIKVYQSITGTTPDAWNAPSRGGALARGQFQSSVDVIFTEAGKTAHGAYRAAARSGRLAIGSDYNQNYMHPGTMLTSMVRRLDLATYQAFMDAKNRVWSSGVQRLGLAENGVGWSLDQHNRDLISAEMETRLEQARQDIIAGALTVRSYSSSRPPIFANTLQYTIAPGRRHIDIVRPSRGANNNNRNKTRWAFSIVGGKDRARFTVAPGGLLSFHTAPKTEGAYVVLVDATSGSGRTAIAIQHEFHITVSNDNHE